MKFDPNADTDPIEPVGWDEIPASCLNILCWDFIPAYLPVFGAFAFFGTYPKSKVFSDSFAPQCAS
jgi:hypothetical protein